MAMTTGILCFLVVTANCYQNNKPVFFVNGRAGAGDPANVNVIKYEVGDVMVIDGNQFNVANLKQYIDRAG